MVRQLLFTGLLVAGTVMFHAFMLTWLFQRARHWPWLADIGYLQSSWQMIRIAWWIVLAHLAEIVLWGVFYVRQGVFADIPTAAYFSAVTYTTVGYGDLVPPEQWRLLAGTEALTGILMCGWSAAFFFSIVSQQHTREAR
jgi:TRAP-type C4-dicarboxylate transport system permease large subunit